jgi:hypothetical protein
MDICSKIAYNRRHAASTALDLWQFNKGSDHWRRAVRGLAALFWQFFAADFLRMQQEC